MSVALSALPARVPSDGSWEVIPGADMRKGSIFDLCANDFCSTTHMSSPSHQGRAIRMFVMRTVRQSFCARRTERFHLAPGDGIRRALRSEAIVRHLGRI